MLLFVPEKGGSATEIPFALHGNADKAYVLPESAGFFNIRKLPPKVKLPAFISIGIFAILLKENRVPKTASVFSGFSAKSVSGILYAAFNSKSRNKNCAPKFAE